MQMRASSRAQMRASSGMHLRANSRTQFEQKQLSLWVLTFGSVLSGIQHMPFQSADPHQHTHH
jgi:hypothetical protein